MASLGIILGGFAKRGLGRYAAAAYLRGRAQAAFDTQGHSKGTPWSPKVVPSTAGIAADLMAGEYPKPWRFSDAALVGSGNLRNSITATVQDDAILLEADADYASQMNNGGTMRQKLGPQMLSPLYRFLDARPEYKKKLGFLYTFAKQRRTLTTKVPPRNFLRPTEDELRRAKELGGP